LSSGIGRKSANVIEAAESAKAVKYLRLSRQIKVLDFRFYPIPKLDVAGSTPVARSFVRRCRSRDVQSPSGLAEIDVRSPRLNVREVARDAAEQLSTIAARWAVSALVPVPTNP
jgi:hypothetical protein